MPATAKWLLALIVLVTSCISWSCRPESPQQRDKEANTPSGKVGQLAYHAAKESGKVAEVALKESGKVAKVAAKDLSKAAHEAHEGWKEASDQDKSKH